MSCGKITSYLFNLFSDFAKYWNNFEIKALPFAAATWGSAYKTHITKTLVKQNHIVRLFFFCTTSLPLVPHTVKKQKESDLY